MRIEMLSDVMVINQTFDDAAFFIQNYLYSNILKFGTRFTEHSVYIAQNSVMRQKQL